MWTSAEFYLCSGRIRNTPEPEEEDNDSSVLSLGLFPGEYVEVPGDDRCMFRFEAAWDSSLHNSVLLNRVTSYGEQIFMTISAYLEVCVYFHGTESLCHCLEYSHVILPKSSSSSLQRLIMDPIQP